MNTVLPRLRGLQSGWAARVNALLLCLVLAGCNRPGELVLAPAARGVGTGTEIFVASSRAVDESTGLYGGDRERAASYGVFEVSVPPERELGTITWPGPREAPDPKEHFLTLRADRFSTPRDFRAALRSGLRELPAGNREVVVFVHGYNTTFAEGLYRIAQLDHDLELPGAVVHYSWPSRAKPLAYVQDRDSTLFARDGFEALLAEIERAGAERIVIVGHSLGAFLTMEALRGLAISGEAPVLNRIGGIILIAPDIDVDVFYQQASRIGTLPQPFYVFTSRRDRALALAARLTGQVDRLGNLTDATRIGDLDVTLIEVGDFSSGLGHFVPGDSPLLLGLLGRLTDVDRAFGSDRAVRPDLITGTVLTFRRATQIVLSPITTIAQEVGN